MGACELAKTFGGGEEAELFDAGDAPLFEALDGGGGGAAGGEHGVEEEGDVNGFVVGEFVVIFDGFKGAFVAEKAEVEDAGVGEEFKESVHHAESGAEDGDKADIAGGAGTKSTSEGRCDRDAVAG